MPLSDVEERSYAPFLAEVQKSIAGSSERIHQAANRAWTIAGAIGAVLIAVGFTESLRGARGLVQLAGITAVVLWLVASILFLRVSVPARKGQLDGYLEAANKELGTPPTSAPEIVKEYTEKRARTIAMRDFLAARLRYGIIAACAAIVATGLALATGVFLSPEVETSGALILTENGQAAVISACPLLATKTVSTGDGGTLELLAEPPPATISDRTAIGGDEPMEVVFEPGVCGDTRMRVYMDAKLLLAIAD